MLRVNSNILTIINLLTLFLPSVGVIDHESSFQTINFIITIIIIWTWSSTRIASSRYQMMIHDVEFMLELF